MLEIKLMGKNQTIIALGEKKVTYIFLRNVKLIFEQENGLFKEKVDLVVQISRCQP